MASMERGDGDLASIADYFRDRAGLPPYPPLVQELDYIPLAWPRLHLLRIRLARLALPNRYAIIDTIPDVSGTTLPGVSRVEGIAPAEPSPPTQR